MGRSILDAHEKDSDKSSYAMTEAKARKIIDFWNNFPPKDLREEIGRGVTLDQAVGYLEALDKAKGLEEFIKTCCDCDGEHTVVCDACQALAKYRSEK